MRPWMVAGVFAGLIALGVLLWARTGVSVWLENAITYCLG